MTIDPTDNSLSMLLPDFDNMSAAQALDYIERTRRQLDRFASLPSGAAGPIDAAEAAAIRKLCDELETSLRAKS